MLARVKQDYKSGSVTAFSGCEYVRSEWREVPEGFEEQARKHELLDTQPSLDEVRAKGPAERGLKVAPTPEVQEAEATPVAEEVKPVEPVVEEKPEAESRTPRRPRKRAEE